MKQVVEIATSEGVLRYHVRPIRPVIEPDTVCLAWVGEAGEYVDVLNKTLICREDGYLLFERV